MIHEGVGPSLSGKFPFFFWKEQLEIAICGNAFIEPDSWLFVVLLLSSQFLRCTCFCSSSILEPSETLLVPATYMFTLSLEVQMPRCFDQVAPALPLPFTPASTTALHISNSA
jgi:hypothetical protein